MDPCNAAPTPPDPDAVEFVRFCYRRRRVGWPELYDEMCAVAGRGLFRGYDADDLAGLGIGFSLFDMPALAVLSTRVVAEEQALRPTGRRHRSRADDGARTRRLAADPRPSRDRGRSRSATADHRSSRPRRPDRVDAARSRLSRLA